MTEISKMVGWLTKFIYEYANGSVEFCSKGLAMLRAILAELAASEPVTEEERKELLQYFNTMDEIVQKHSPVGKVLKKLGVRRVPTARADQIRALILGKQGGAVTEKWIEEKTAYIAEYPSFYRVRKVLEEAGVAGKEGR